MNLSISHDRQDETIEAKVLWFRSLTIEERMDIFTEFTEFLLAINPDLMKKKDVQPIKGRIQIISLP